MILDTETSSWLAFAGCAFALMGVSLAADARGHAASAAAWSGSGARQTQVAAAYRAAGSAFVALGAALVAGAWLRPRALSALARPIHLGRVERLAAGALLAVVGAGLALNRLSIAQPRRLPGGLAADGSLPGEPVPLGQRAASTAAWLLSLEFLLFGFLLLSRQGGLAP